MENERVRTMGFRREDRDLLVELSTKMTIMQTDVKELRDNTAVRLAQVERDKIDRAEIATMKIDSDKRHEELIAKDESLETKIGDIDKKVDVFIARMTTWGSVALIGLGIAEFLIQLWLRNH